VKRTILVVWVGIALIVAGLVAAEPEPEPTPEPIGGLTFADEVQVTVVNVDVYVRDKNGLSIEGLKKEDFVIYQNGITRDITHFAIMTEDLYQSVAIPAPDGSVAPTPTPVPDAPTAAEIKPIYIVLYIDNENIRPIDRNRVLRHVRGFVVDNMYGPVQMMVVSYQRSLKVMQDFTSDTRSVNDALRGLRKYTGGRNERDRARQDAIRIIREGQDQQSRQNRSPTGATMSTAYAQIMAFADEEANNLTFSLSALRQVINMLAGLEGRKSIIYVSDGLPMVPGLGLMYEFSNTFQDTGVLNNRGRYDRSREFRSLVAAANGQNVSFYTIDAQGLAVDSGISAEYGTNRDVIASSMTANNYQDSIRYMADATGGIAIVNMNDFTRGLKWITQDLHTYYSLGFTVGSTGNDKVHHIKVDMPAHDYRIRYRKRFVEKSLETKVQDKVMTSLLFDIAENPMLLKLETGQLAPASKDRWTVPVHTSVPLDKVALLPEGDDYVGRVVLFVAARDTDGKQSDLQQQEHEIRIPSAEYEAALKKRFGFNLSLLMEEGSYRITIALMDRVTRQASYYRAQVHVPR